MTTLFIDYEGGNDNYGGTSFALLASGTDGRITSTTFSSATASFPNDGSLIGQYLTIWNASIYAAYKITAWLSGTSLTIEAISGGTALADQGVDRQYYIGGRWKTITSGATAARLVAGDALRLKASPAPTSIGNATWTGNPVLTGSVITSSTNATPIVIRCSGHGLSDNDFVLVSGHATNTNANGIWQITYIDSEYFSLDGSVGNGVGGATGGFRKVNNAIVQLASPLTQTIAGCSQQEGAWTASANVTATVNTTDYKNHYGSASIAIGASFTTGMAAYFATGTLDLSGYKQVSFWIKQTSGTVMADSDLSLTLCSDTAGATPVNTINVPSPKILNQWAVFTIDTGAALGASIQSVALNVNTDNGAQTFQIGLIIACKDSTNADSLSLTSLIGKNTAGETFRGIASINGTRVVLDNHTNHVASNYTNTLIGYSSISGSTETVTTYKRETVKITPSAALTATAYNASQESGVDGSLISYTGGWETNMSVQSGETWFDGQNGAGVGLSFGGGTRFLNGESLRVARFYFGFFHEANGGPFYADDIQAVNCTNGLVVNTPYSSFIGSVMAKGCSTGIAITGAASRTVIDSCVLRDCADVASAITNNCNRTVIKYYELGGGFGLTNNYQVAGVVVQSGRFDHALRINNTANGWPEQYLSNIIVDNVVSPFLHTGGAAAYSSGRTTYHNYNNTQNDHRILGYFGTIVTDPTVVYGDAAYSWKFSPTTTNANADWPLDMPLRAIALAANVSKTITVQMRRSNTNLTMKLVCRGGQIAGIANDVSTSMTYAEDLWEPVSITLTPTETGVVELEVHAYGGATYNGWVSKMEVV